MSVLEPLDHVIACVVLSYEDLVVELDDPDGGRLLVFLEPAVWMTAGGVGCRVGALRVTDPGQVDDAIRALFPPGDVSEADWAQSRQLDLLDKETGRVVLSAVGEDWSLSRAGPRPSPWSQ